MTQVDIWTGLAEGRVSQEVLDQLVPLVVASAPDPPDWFVVRAKKIAGPDQPGVVRSKFTVLHPTLKALRFDSAMALRPASVRRTGTQERRLVYETELFTVYLEVAPVSDDAVSVKGQLVSREQTLGWRVGLWDDDLRVVLGAVDTSAEGFFALSDVDPRRSMMLTVGGEAGWSSFPLSVCGSLPSTGPSLPL